MCLGVLFGGMRGRGYARVCVCVCGGGGHLEGVRAILQAKPIHARVSVDAENSRIMAVHNIALFVHPWLGVVDGRAWRGRGHDTWAMAHTILVEAEVGRGRDICGASHEHRRRWWVGGLTKLANVLYVVVRNIQSIDRVECDGRQRHLTQVLHENVFDDRDVAHCCP